MAPKAPAARGFTVAEKRSLGVERRSFHLTWVVALLAAVMSFVALQWVALQMDMATWVAPILPLTIDGLGIICSFGIIRSHGAGEPFRNRASEWLGLSISLALSMAGNASHALGVTPPWLKVVYAVAVPGIVAYSIHVLGRYMESGVSAHVMADDPDKIAFGVAHLGDTHAQPARAKATPVARAPRATTTAQTARPGVAQPAQETTPTRAPAVRAVAGEKAEAKALFDEAVRANPSEKPDASAIHDAIGSTKDRATTRRWIQGWWEEQQAANPTQDPILEQMQGGREKVQVRSA